MTSVNKCSEIKKVIYIKKAEMEVSAFFEKMGYTKWLLEEVRNELMQAAAPGEPFVGSTL